MLFGQDPPAQITTLTIAHSVNRSRGWNELVHREGEVFGKRILKYKESRNTNEILLIQLKAILNER
jgi:hypothetical protein